MMTLAPACIACSFPPLPWNLSYTNPLSHYFAWGIAVLACIGFVYPFCMGYRLGKRMEYSFLRHLVYGMLPFFFLFFSFPTFGGSIAFLLSFPFVACLLLAEEFCSSIGPALMFFCIRPLSDGSLPR